MLRGMGELFGLERIPSGQDKRARSKRLAANGRSAECKSNLLCRPIRRIRQLAAALHRAGAWPPCCTERGARQRVSEALLWRVSDGCTVLWAGLGAAECAASLPCAPPTPTWTTPTYTKHTPGPRGSASTGCRHPGTPFPRPERLRRGWKHRHRKLT